VGQRRCDITEGIPVLGGQQARVGAKPRQVRGQQRPLLGPTSPDPPDEELLAAPQLLPREPDPRVEHLVPGRRQEGRRTFTERAG
jgi:hypothetical protein